MAQSPYDRGSADAYYRRPPSPHKWLDNTGHQRDTDLTPAEIEDYWTGFDAQEDYKDWGRPDD
jgi:hypothetical protein